VNHISLVLRGQASNALPGAAPRRAQLRHVSSC